MSVSLATVIDAAEAMPAPAELGHAIRRCLVSGEEREKAALLRFVVGPDGAIVPDIEGRLPGRGLWTLARRDIVAAAVGKRLFSRAARQATTSDPGLVDRIGALLARRCVATLGLARRAGQAVGGTEKVRALIAHGDCGAVVIAVEASAEGRRKLDGAGSIAVAEGLTEAELGGAFGRDTVTYAALRRGGLALRLLADAQRLCGFRGATIVGQ